MFNLKSIGVGVMIGSLISGMVLGGPTWYFFFGIGVTVFFIGISIDIEFQKGDGETDKV